MARTSFVDYWKEAKKKHKTKTGAKKSTRQTGVEKALADLDKAMSAKSPDLNGVYKLMAAAKIKMTAYKSELSLPDDKTLIHGLDKVSKMIDTTKVTLEKQEELYADQSKKLKDAGIRFARLNTLVTQIGADIDKTKQKLATEKKATAILRYAEKIVTLDKAVKKLQHDYSKESSSIRNLYQ